MITLRWHYLIPNDDDVVELSLCVVLEELPLNIEIFVFKDVQIAVYMCMHVRIRICACVHVHMNV